MRENRIAVVSMVKNEADIVESFVRHALTFADKIFVCDHKSTDKTRFILDSLREEGLNLEISTYPRDEKAQMIVTNKLLKRAFEEGFDIVMPLDCDEFPIFIDGSAKDLRKYLQQLDTNQYYRVLVYEARFADSETSKYALARSIVKEPKESSIMPKTIVCREFVKNYPASISQGNHTLWFKGESQPFKTESKIFYAHFSQRSSEQLISKYSTSRLNTILNKTRYTGWAIHCEKFLREYVKDSSIAKIDLAGFIPIELSEYKNEATLKFSGGGGQKFQSEFVHSGGEFCQSPQSRENSGGAEDRSDLSLIRWRSRACNSISRFDLQTDLRIHKDLRGFDESRSSW